MPRILVHRISRFAATLLMAALPATVGHATPLQRAEASRVVYDTGIASADALLVIAAAKMRRDLGLTRSNRMAEDSEATDATALDAEEMLETAREFATGDPILEGLIEDILAEKTKGVVSGPVYNIARIGAGKSDIYRDVPFESAAYAEVYVEAKDSSDLNLRITDDQGRLVCADTDSSAIAYCGWSPRDAGTFSIEVQNVSGRTVDYSMITN